MSVRDKWVRRFSIDETAKHKNGFTIYKITSVLFPLESPEAVTVVSVWKRYSDVQRLHKAMSSLHAGLHLRGTFPALAKSNYFKRFNPEVIEERTRTIKALLEFVADHRLLFTSTDFVNFLQSGYAEPARAGGVIDAIRSSLHLPIEDAPPLEYQSSDDDGRTPSATGELAQVPQSPQRATDSRPHIDTIDVSQIPIYEAADVEIRESPKTEQPSNSNSFESLNSLDSIGSDLFDELNKVTIDNKKSLVKRNVLPDLINFDAPSTSKFEDYHTMEDAASLSSSTYGPASSACESHSRRSAAEESGPRTEDGYVFEAGYLLSLAARCEHAEDYHRAFDCYKAGIEKMLIGVQTDSDQQRRALIKEKTNKYLAHAEDIYKNHLCNVDQSLLSEREERGARAAGGVPARMLRRPYEELAAYRVLGVLGAAMMLVLHEHDHACYAMKVIQKIPNNLMEFDHYFQQRTNETRQPILPTVVPYMVPLHAYVDTENLLFLILAYAPGEKLFDYIKNYAKSIPNTPARELNLENVFAEPRKINIDVRNDNDVVDHTDANVNIDTKIASRFSNTGNKIDLQTKIDDKDDNVVIDKLSSKYKFNSSTECDRVKIDVIGDINENVGKTDNLDSMEVSELVINSQKLLRNVDKALTEVPKICRMEEEADIQEVEKEKGRDAGRKADHGRVETPSSARLSPHFHRRDVLPPTRVCLWGAQMLTALESLHNAGVVCRDLNPSNILLGERGQIILTYFVSYHDKEVFAAKLHAHRHTRAYIAPELRECVCAEEGDAALERACDFWSFGAIMYELICGYPLSAAHPHIWSHTAIQLPDAVPLEARELLTQLLCYSPAARLGAVGGARDVMQHPYFRHVDWRHVYDAWVPPG